jgi:putative methyltransferase (TIGR04325 family)
MQLLGIFKYYFIKIRRIFSSKIHNGYNNLIINKSIIKKTVLFNKLERFNKNDKNCKRTIKFLNFVRKRNFKKIVDFGGGAGYHYFIAKKKMPSFNFKWIIIENPKMVQLCNKEFKYENLFFYNSLKKINKLDIFFSSCAINYTKNPIKTLKIISKLDAKYFYFTRTPLSENASLTYNQFSCLADNGPLRIRAEEKIFIEYQNKIINIKNFEGIFKDNFNIILKYVDEKNAFFFKGKSFDTYTYIIKRKKI